MPAKTVGTASTVQRTAVNVGSASRVLIVLKYPFDGTPWWICDCPTGELRKMKTGCYIRTSVLLLLPFATTVSAQKFDVKIVDRQDSETGYTYFAPGHFSSQSNSNVNCYDDATCNQTTTSSGTITPAQRISYEVRGATFTLLLPDGRGAVVNCESKYQPKGDYINRRSCRVPLVDDIQAEFHGDKAKLVWVVSLDGKKTQSETYKVLAILNKPTVK